MVLASGQSGSPTGMRGGWWRWIILIASTCFGSCVCEPVNKLLSATEVESTGLRLVRGTCQEIGHCFA